MVGRKPGRPPKSKEAPKVEVNEYKPDDLVWVKMRGYPWWPARVNIII